MTGSQADRCVAFNLGQVAYAPSLSALKRAVYDAYGLDWPYDAETGKHRAGA